MNPQTVRTLKPVRRPPASRSIDTVLRDVIEYLEQNKEHYLIKSGGKLCDMLTDCRKVLLALKNLDEDKKIHWEAREKVKYVPIFPLKLHQTLIGETDNYESAMQWKDYQDYFAINRTKSTYEKLLSGLGLKELHGSWDGFQPDPLRTFRSNCEEKLYFEEGFTDGQVGGTRGSDSGHQDSAANASEMFGEWHSSEGMMESDTGRTVEPTSYTQRTGCDGCDLHGIERAHSFMTEEDLSAFNEKHATSLEFSDRGLLARTLSDRIHASQV